MTYDAAIDWLFSFQRFGMKLGLDNIRALTEALGRPQDRFASVLVAGTNGKGSTAAMLHQILVAGGVRSGLYTSPHLVRTEERIRIGDGEIGAEALAATLTEIRATVDGMMSKGTLAAHPTFFEVITAAAFVSFARAGVELAVLEVGLGGRLDATNVVSPVLSIITSIDLDHQEQLGPTLASIAREKAGILRRGGVGLVGETREEPLGAIREEAAAIGARVVVAGDGCRVEVLPSRGARAPLELALTTPAGDYPRLVSPLRGDHQVANVLLAVRAAETLSEASRLDGASASAALRTIGSEAIAAGLAASRWPGRLDWIDGRPPLLLDGAHNPAGCRALAAYLDAQRIRPVLLFASMRDKEVATMLEILLPRVSAAVFTRPDMARAADPADLMTTASRLRMGTRAEDAHAGTRRVRADTPSEGEARGRARADFEDAKGRLRAKASLYVADPDIASALSRARALAGPSGVVLAAGSLFLVGAVKAILEGAAVRSGGGA